jgi:hypothetical protein
MNKNLFYAAGLMSVLTGCAELPNATITYYLPKSNTTITATQTIACDSAKNPSVTVMLNAKPTYTADYSEAGKKSIAIKSLDGALSDTDVTVSLTEDGRLKGINSSQTGQAEAVIKEAVTVAAAIVAVGFVDGVKPAPNWCASAAASKPVTITYTAGPYQYKDLVFDKDATPIQMVVDSGSLAVYHAVKKTSLGKNLEPALVIHASQEIQPVSEESPTAGVPVTLPRMRKVTLELFWGVDDKFEPMSVGTQDLFLPGEGANRTFALNIPPSAMFGTQKFVLQLADSGAITSIQYVKTTGAASALTAGQDVLAPFKPESTADRAADVKAQADLIAQQQRLAACKAVPSTCSK